MEESARLIGKTSLTPMIVSSSVKYLVSAFPNETAVACDACTVPVAPELKLTAAASPQELCDSDSLNVLVVFPNT